MVVVVCLVVSFFVFVWLFRLGRLGRLGLAWLGLAWLGLAWPGLAWLGLAWLGLVWFGLVWFGLFWLFVCSFVCLLLLSFGTRALMCDVYGHHDMAMQ